MRLSARDQWSHRGKPTIGGDAEPVRNLVFPEWIERISAKDLQFPKAGCQRKQVRDQPNGFARRLTYNDMVAGTQVVSKDGRGHARLFWPRLYLQMFRQLTSDR